MWSFYKTPIDQALTNLWNSLSSEYKKAFFIVVAVNLLAFGYEMTNLTLHHDDVGHIFIQDPKFGYDLGRFGLGWLYYYGQGAHFMPFLQMFESIILMTLYGMIAAHLWGTTKTTEIVFVAAIVSVFPFMAQVYQYNTAMFTYPLAHLLAASAVLLSTRTRLIPVVAASFLYVIAFSIYQSVVANAATIFLIWILARLLFTEAHGEFDVSKVAKSSVAAFIAVLFGGLLYLAALSVLNIQFDTYQGADKAFTLSDGIDPAYVASEIAKGTRSFFFWPENYFPNYLKKLQLAFLVSTVFLCFWLPKGIAKKVLAGVILFFVLIAPRSLQVLHPEGNYHNLTLTGYAVVIAGFVMITNRAGTVMVRNLSILLATGLIAGYVIQCNWISTVNQLNTYAHYTTMSQILGRIKSLNVGHLEGKKAVVVGSYDMPSDYPFKPATGVAKEFIDAPHMQKLARLMREEVIFVQADESMPGVWEYAMKHSKWPHPDSVGVVDGVPIVVLSKEKMGIGALRVEPRSD